MPRPVTLALFLLMWLPKVAAQEGTPYPFITLRVEDGDTVPTILLPEKRVEGFTSARARRQAARYDRLVRNVVKVWPYARVSAELLEQYGYEVAAITSDRQRDLYMKLAEAELRAEFEAEITDLTITQGGILIKLIDRETGSTGYDLVKQLRGGFQAFIWQGVAKLFGNDLKDDYDPLGEDAMIEQIVLRIQAGELAVAAREARTPKATARLEKRKARLFKRYGLTASDRVH